MQLILTISIAHNMDYLNTYLTVIQNKKKISIQTSTSKLDGPYACFQIQVHGSDWTSFYEQVPKEVLPTDYGGKDGSVAEHWGESGKIVFIRS